MSRCARLPRARQVLANLGLAALVASGCVSARPLDPGAALEPGEGILVMDIDAEIEIGELGFGAATAARNLSPGRHFYLLAVPAGRYRWTRLTIPARSGREVHFLISRDEITQFRVDPGRINYTGRILFKGRVGEQWMTWRGELLNRSAEAARRLLEDYPELVERYPMSFAGPYRDDFLDHLSRQSVSATPGAGNEVEP